MRSHGPFSVNTIKEMLTSDMEEWLEAAAKEAPKTDTELVHQCFLQLSLDHCTDIPFEQHRRLHIAPTTPLNVYDEIMVALCHRYATDAYGSCYSLGRVGKHATPTTLDHVCWFAGLDPSRGAEHILLYCMFDCHTHDKAKIPGRRTEMIKAVADMPTGVDFIKRVFSILIKSMLQLEEPCARFLLERFPDMIDESTVSKALRDSMCYCLTLAELIKTKFPHLWVTDVSRDLYAELPLLFYSADQVARGLWPSNFFTAQDFEWTLQMKNPRHGTLAQYLSHLAVRPSAPEIFKSWAQPEEKT